MAIRRALRDGEGEELWGNERARKNASHLVSQAFPGGLNESARLSKTSGLGGLVIGHPKWGIARPLRRDMWQAFRRPRYR